MSTPDPKWRDDHTSSDPWWADTDTRPRCPTCGTTLDTPERACPFAPHDEVA